MGVGLGVLVALRLLGGSKLESKFISQPQPTPRVKEVYKPVKFSISKLGISTNIEEVGFAEDGRMDTPKDINAVGWWKFGRNPGQVGTSVIAGHLDTPQGTPAVFYNLSELNIGDEIVVTDERNNIFTFTIKRKEEYLDKDFPIEEVFSQDGGKYLNLITCWGKFNKTEKNYDKRLVVFSELSKVDIDAM